MKFILGLTGQTGAGKTTAGAVAEKSGFYIIDCDKVAREVTAKGCPVLERLADAFGKEIIVNSELDRAKLAAAAFGSKENTEKLNSIILPYIIAKIEEYISATKSERILLDAPTLFESGAHSICSVTVGVTAPVDIRLKRITTRDNISESAALARIKAGKSDEFFKENCDYVIENRGSEAEFINNFEILLKNILGGK